MVVLVWPQKQAHWDLDLFSLAHGRSWKGFRRCRNPQHLKNCIRVDGARVLYYHQVLLYCSTRRQLVHARNESQGATPGCTQ
jgi:hypothetical protein